MLNGGDERRGWDGEKSAGLLCEESCRTSLQIAQSEKTPDPFVFASWQSTMNVSGAFALVAIKPDLSGLAGPVLARGRAVVVSRRGVAHPTRQLGRGGPGR